MKFVPDYQHVVDVAVNREAKRLPLYEHIISPKVMEKILGRQFSELIDGDVSEKREFFRNYNNFFREMGYDTVSFECCVGEAMPGSGALGRHVDPAIKDMDDFKTYPWDEVPDIYFNKYSKDFEAFRDTMPEGMKGIGGVGNGIFECVQELAGFENLCYIKFDDPELYALLFTKVADTLYEIWGRFLKQYGDSYCVCRMGDDLGFKSSTLLESDDIRTHIIPQYRRIVEQVHHFHKPFLFHSCGCIWDVMDDIIEIAKIDAKHSNEDQIAPFNVWVERYGDRIGNFGGMDTDAVCRLCREDIHEYVFDMIRKCVGHGGFAFSTGNSIPDYVPAEGYLAMVEAVRQYRGE